MVKETIYVDESGNSGLRNNNAQKYPFFVIGFCFFCDPMKFKIEMKRLLKKLHRKGKYHTGLKELKFSPDSALEKLGCSRHDIETIWKPHFDYVRKKANELIVQHTDGVYAAILDKRTITRNTWTSETIGNYIFNITLFRNILPLAEFSFAPEVIYDRERISPVKTIEFNNYMMNTDSYLSNIGKKKYSGNAICFRDENSINNSGLWGADFVAGSFRRMYFQSDSTYLDILRSKFLGDGSRNFWF